jgi:hypothetical protein
MATGGLWFTLFCCKVLSFHKHGNCVKEHHKSTYHSMNLRWHDAMARPSRAISHAPLFRLVICTFNWSTVGAQEPIGHIFHVKISPLFCKLPYTHTSHDLHHLVTGLQRQMYPCVRKLVSLVSCECEWMVCGRDWLWNLILYVMLRTQSVPNQYHCSFLARLYCPPCNQW